MEPSRVEYDVGKDIHNRAVKLIRERKDGRWSWTIRRAAASQLDESAVIYDLTDECIENMHRAMRGA